jgi:hypothetical protein
MTERVGLFLAYVLSRDEGFKGDMFMRLMHDGPVALNVD